MPNGIALSITFEIILMVGTYHRKSSNFTNTWYWKQARINTNLLNTWNAGVSLHIRKNGCSGLPGIPGTCLSSTWGSFGFQVYIWSPPPELQNIGPKQWPLMIGKGTVNADINAYIYIYKYNIRIWFWALHLQINHNLPINTHVSPRWPRFAPNRWSPFDVKLSWTKNWPPKKPPPKT